MSIYLGVKIWLTLGVLAWTWHFLLRDVHRYGESYLKSWIRLTKEMINCYASYETPHIQKFTKAWWVYIFPLLVVDLMYMVSESMMIILIPPVVFTCYGPNRQEF